MGEAPSAGAELLSVQTRVQSLWPKTKSAIVALEGSGNTASGVIVSPEGLVLTAAHVTGEVGRKINVMLPDGRSVEGTTLGMDTSTDAAMVQLPKPAKAWPFIPVNRDPFSLSTGGWCFALGHPGGYDKERGVVLRVGRLIKVASNMVQTDCVLMGGDSGGALVNLQGELIGINSQIWRGRDQNLHVSMAPYLRSWDAMARGETIRVWKTGSGGWIGLSTAAHDRGLQIQAIAPASPALAAGLKVGEFILELNRSKISIPADFSNFIRGRRAGQIVTLKVNNGTGDRIVEVKLGPRPED